MRWIAGQGKDRSECHAPIDPTQPITPATDRPRPRTCGGSGRAVKSSVRRSMTPATAIQSRDPSWTRRMQDAPSPNRSTRRPGSYRPRRGHADAAGRPDDDACHHRSARKPIPHRRLTRPAQACARIGPSAHPAPGHRPLRQPQHRCRVLRSRRGRSVRPERRPSPRPPSRPPPARLPPRPATAASSRA